jgi:hypothetical protein
VEFIPPRRPNPVRLQRTLRLHEVDFHRRVGCRHYLYCLDRAARRTWLSFTCVRCFAFRPRFSETPDDWLVEDALRFIAAGRANRIFPSTEVYLAFRRMPERAQI